MYKQLSLGELKPTNITLSLADRSVKIPKGIIEDVFVKVDKFYYPVDFVVLDTEPIASGPNHVPIIHGKTIFGHGQCDNQLPKWSNAAHIWKHDIGSQQFSLESQAQANGR